MVSNIKLDDDRQLNATGRPVSKTEDESMRHEPLRKPERRECAEWEAQLNQAILATDIREGWEGFVEVFDRFYDEEVTVIVEDEGSLTGQSATHERLLQVLVPLHVVTELDVVQIERFELEESVVAENRETRSTWLLETASPEMGSRTWCWTARREWREGRVISETLAAVENRVRGPDDPVTFHG
jgi:hypothetical protein